MAEYKMKAVPKFGNEEETQRYRAELVYNGTADTLQMAKHIASHTVFDVATVQGVVEELMREMAWRMSNGEHVRLGDLGNFSLSLKAPLVEKKSSLHAQQVSYGEVRFRYSKEFGRRVKGKLERSRYGNDDERATSTVEERKALLLTHFEEKNTITVREYGSLSGLKHTMAAMELKAWAEEGLLKREGSGSHVFYTLKATG